MNKMLLSPYWLTHEILLFSFLLPLQIPPVIYFLPLILHLESFFFFFIPRGKPTLNFGLDKNTIKSPPCLVFILHYLDKEDRVARIRPFLPLHLGKGIRHGVNAQY